MDPSNPADAQLIVIEYARVLERDIEERRHPAVIDSLPFSKVIIQTAIKTSVVRLNSSGQLTDDLREFLETAYTSLAEYLPPELVTLITEYRKNGDQLIAGPAPAHEKTKTAVWRTLVEGASLAGEVARLTADEAERLRSEFRVLVNSS